MKRNEYFTEEEIRDQRTEKEEKNRQTGHGTSVGRHDAVFQYTVQCKCGIG